MPLFNDYLNIHEMDSFFYYSEILQCAVWPELVVEGTLHSKLTLGFFLAGLKVYIIVTYLSQIARL